MPLSTIKFLLISMATLLFISCARHQYFPKQTASIDDSQLLNSYFSDTLEIPSYRTTIHFGKHQIVGLLVIRTYHSDLRRVALVSDFGQTVFDVSIFRNHHVVNSMLPALDNRFVTKELVNIFRTMTQPQNSEMRVVGSEHHPIYIITAAGKKNRYYFEENKLLKIEQYDKRKLRFEIRFDLQAGLPNSIDILHIRYPLKMTLQRQEKL